MLESSPNGLMMIDDHSRHYRRYLPYLVDGFNHLERYESQWEGLSQYNIVETCSKHQPDIQGLWLDIATSPMAKHMAQYSVPTVYFRSLTWPLFLWVKTIF